MARKRTEERQRTITAEGGLPGPDHIGRIENQHLMTPEHGPCVVTVAVSMPNGQVIGKQVPTTTVAETQETLTQLAWYIAADLDALIGTLPTAESASNSA
ncbi:MAG TPA: hypothetical protein VHL57_03865 [Flavobacteriales bacterium]|jgi:hypothetical protein|nr:hypothetical protein [Flavobacteriales bacterium]